MTLLTTREAQAAHQRHESFFRAAVRLGYLRAVKLHPVVLVAEEVGAFMMGLTTDQVRAVNAFLKSKRPRKGHKPALPGRSAPGRKPGAGLIGRIREERNKTAQPGSGGTGAGNLSSEARAS